MIIWGVGVLDRDWRYDTVSFEAQIRRSGGSLVITIPPELRDRFLIKEGQKVRIIGVTREVPYIEGGLLIYLGRFILREKAPGLRFEIRARRIDEETLRELNDLLTMKYNATSIYTDRSSGNVIKYEVVLGSVTERGLIIRDKRVVKDLEKDLRRFAERYNLEITGINEFEEEIEWNNVDPSILKRYFFSIPNNISFEWVIT